MFTNFCRRQREGEGQEEHWWSKLPSVRAAGSRWGNTFDDHFDEYDADDDHFAADDDDDDDEKNGIGD